MSSHPPRATIEPVADGGPRPLWSVMIPTYNCASYLVQTLESVLAQDPGADLMQIEVVDDHSTLDDPAEVVGTVGRGRVGFHRQSQNVGHVRNFATCLSRSRGRLIHLLHGDDYVLHGFYAQMGAPFAAHPEIGFATCRHLYAAADGHWFGISQLRQHDSGVWRNALEEVTVRGGLQTPSVVVRRECYEALGGFDERLLRNEDYEMWVRIAAHYPVWYEPRCLAVYRFRSNSNSPRGAAMAEDIDDIQRVVGIITADTNPGLRPGWQRFVVRAAKHSVIRQAGTLFADGDSRTALTILWEAFKRAPGPDTVARTALALLKAMMKRIGKRLLAPV